MKLTEIVFLGMVIVGVTACVLVMPSRSEVKAHWDAYYESRRQETPAMIEWPRIVTTHGRGHGTGFMVGPELVLTAAHCVGHPDMIVGDRPATVVKINIMLDVALLRLPGLTGSSASFADARLGQEVWIAGDVPWQGDNERIVYQGYVADVAFGKRMLIGSASQPGLSGCPVMNDRGEVTGMLIAVRKIWGHPSFGNVLAVPTATLIAFIEEEVHAVRHADPAREGSTPCRPDRIGVEIPGPGCETVPQMAE